MQLRVCNEEGTIGEVFIINRKLTSRAVYSDIINYAVYSETTGRSYVIPVSQHSIASLSNSKYELDIIVTALKKFRSVNYVKIQI